MVFKINISMNLILYKVNRLARANGTINKIFINVVEEVKFDRKTQMEQHFVSSRFFFSTQQFE